jgi:hypothetical protein
LLSPMLISVFMLQFFGRGSVDAEIAWTMDGGNSRVRLYVCYCG